MQSLGRPGGRGIGLCHVCALLLELLRQSEHRCLPMIRIDVVEQAVNDLAGSSPSLIVRNEVEQGKARVDALSGRADASLTSPGEESSGIH